VERLVAGWSGPVTQFDVATVNTAGSPFQGHKLVRVEGVFKPAAGTGKAGDFLVRTAQPLGALAFYILEPESIDGAVAWGFVKQAPVANSPYAILKCPSAPLVATELVK
jgi:hypothetical protein